MRICNVCGTETGYFARPLKYYRLTNKHNGNLEKIYSERCPFCKTLMYGKSEELDHAKTKTN